MEVHSLLLDLKKVRERGIAKTRLADVPALRKALSQRWPGLDDVGLEVRLEEFLAEAAQSLGDHGAQGIRLALGIGGLGGNSADRREDFAAHYDRTAETVRKRGGLEDQALTRLAKAILALVENGSTPNAARDRLVPAQVATPPTVEAVSPESPLPVAETRVQATARRIVVGTPAGVASSYQRRGFDEQVDRLWTDGADRRVWLRGGPGLGKSYSARRIMREALAEQGPHRDELLVWVDSADAATLAQALSTAVDRMPHLGLAVAPEESDRVERQARALLEALVGSDWRWLLVLDNADAGSLIDARLIPSGTNPNGRVLITTTSQDQRITGNGRVVSAALYTAGEAEAYLRAQLDSRHGGPAALASAPVRELRALSKAVGSHPLALSVAAATIVANDMSVDDWIAEFNDAGPMDAAADHPDQGGYPHLIGASWRIALARAAQGLPPGVVERAAAVAAVLDPDGHPTWLWDREAVVAWVADGAVLERTHGRPIAVQRLIDHGITQLAGDTWKDGELTIHSLAARSVRELMDNQDLARLAGILLQELGNEDATGDAWVVQTETILRSITRLLAIPGLSPRKRSEGLALSSYLHNLRWEGRATMAATLEAYEAIATIPPDDPDYDERWLATRLIGVALTRLSPGQSEAAAVGLGRVLEIFEGLPSSDKASDRDQLAVILTSIGQLQEGLGQMGEAAASRARALHLAQAPNDEETSPKKLATRLFMMGTLQGKLGMDGQAEQSLIGAAKTLRPTQIEHPYSAVVLALILQELAPIQGRLGHRSEAKASYAERVEVLQRLADAGSIWAGANLSQSLADFTIAAVRDPVEDNEDAMYVRAVEVTARLAETAPDTIEFQHAFALCNLAIFQQGHGRLIDAAENYTRAAAIYEFLADLSAHDPASCFNHRANAAAALAKLGEVQVKQEQFDLAEETLTRATDLFRSLAEADPGNTLVSFSLAGALKELGSVQGALGNEGEAEANLTRAVNLYQLLVDLGQTGLPVDVRPSLRSALFELGLAQAHVGLLEEAESSLLRSIEIARRLADEQPGERMAVAVGLVHLADIQERLGKETQVEATRAELKDVARDLDAEE